MAHWRQQICRVVGKSEMSSSSPPIEFRGLASTVWGIGEHGLHAFISPEGK